MGAFHHLNFVMSLSGSLVVLLYGLTYSIAQKYFPHTWRKNILCLSLFFYLTPIPLLKEFVLSHLKKHFPLPNGNLGVNGPLNIDPKYTINMEGNQFSLGFGVIIIYIFAFCMAIISLTVVIKQLKQYSTIYRTYLLKSFYEAPPPQLEQIFVQTKKDLQLKKSVKFICSRLCETPMTIGVFSPTIVFPVSDKLNLKSDDCKYILRHELLHIKNRDLLIKFMALFALIIHWYNPICYLLYHELCVVSEMDCDYGVIQDTNDIQRQQYSHLILDLAVVGNSRKERFAVGLVNNNAATFERRILEMKKTRKTAKPFLSFLVMTLICIMGTVTAFSYQTPIKVETEEAWTKYDTVFFLEHDSDVEEHFLYDYFFADKNGNIISLEDASPRLFCKHDFVEGYVKKHKKNSDGSCIVKTNECVRCSVCGYVKEGALVSEYKYTVCPH